MAIPLHIAGLATQSPQGIGARIARRLGGAMCSAWAGGLSLAGRLRRGAAPRATRNPSPPHHPGSPSRSRVRQPQLAVAAPPPARTGWLTRWLGLRPRAGARLDTAPIPGLDTPFTPHMFPGFSDEACAILNTPLEECDPEIARLLFAGLAEFITAHLPADAGVPDTDTLYATLMARFGSLCAKPHPAAAPSVPPEQPPVAGGADPQDPPAADASALPPREPIALAFGWPGRFGVPLLDLATDRPGWALDPHETDFLRSSIKGRGRAGVRGSVRLHATLWRSLRARRRTLPAPRLAYAACAGPPCLSARPGWRGFARQ